VKTYNSGININLRGEQVEPIARWLQREGFGIGVVTNVPFSHATVACAYANNLDRDDYQDLTRDMMGLPSVAHPQDPLVGVDVLIGGGWGEDKADDRQSQGQNFVPGNKFLTAADNDTIDQNNGGNYVIAERTANMSGKNILDQGAGEAVKQQSRLFGFFGISGGHLPYRTADGMYDPTRGQKYHDKYSPADVSENPTLADMTAAALTVLEGKRDSKGIWLMVEAGDVDWANHNNNLDDSIGAVLSGEEAFDVIVKWIEKHKSWDDTLLVVTADHGHFFNLVKPEVLIRPRSESAIDQLLNR
jgi:alkaline phosphatase